MKRWVVKKIDPNSVNRIVEETGLEKLCAEVLVARNFLTSESVYEFISGDELSDPFMLADMENACETIIKFIDNGELICVYGDYDCDGVTATAILYDYLLNMGANVMYYIPERDDGYGMSKKSIDELNERGVKLIITVDNGISAIEEAQYIKELGMKLVITDHHQPQEELPEAEAVVDPHRKGCVSPFKDLCGAGVALKLCAALDDGNYDIVLDQYADLVSVATVADIVPLVGENRILVQKGIEAFHNTENAGLAFLSEKGGISVENMTSTGMAFGIAPRINAAGRFGSPITALKTLLCETEDADELTDELISLNNKRKTTEVGIFEEIIRCIDSNPEILKKRVLVLRGDNWHHGVVGIVAARLLERFEKPVFVTSFDDDGVGRGSSRGMQGFNIFKALEYSKDVLEKFGGHECAGGYTVTDENFSEFERLINEYADTFYDVMPQLTISSDKILTPDDLTVASVESLSTLEPFGEGNPSPVFVIMSAKVERVIPISNGKHLRLELLYGGMRVSALLFSATMESTNIKQGDVMDFMVTLDVNTYKGVDSVSVKVKDFRLSGIKQEQYFAAKDCYERYYRLGKIDKNVLERAVPSREDLVFLYKYFCSFEKPFNYETAYMRVFKNLNYCKYRFCIDIFNEIGLVDLKAGQGILCKNPVSKKVDLDSSKLYNDLKGLLN